MVKETILKQALAGRRVGSLIPATCVTRAFQAPSICAVISNITRDSSAFIVRLVAEASMNGGIIIYT